LDQPVYVQYLKWAKGVLTGDWGYTFFGGRPVFDVVIERVPATLIMMGTAFSLAMLMGIVIGAFAAINRGSIFDYLSTTGAVIAYSLPTFWFGLVTIYFLAVKRRWLPAGGMYELGGDETILDLLYHLFLPSVVLGLVIVAQWSRYARSSFLEVLYQDYIRTARSKGASKKRLFIVHAFPNAAAPLVVLAGIQFPYLLGGALVTETVFTWPGMGRLFLEALRANEYPILMGIMMFASVAVILGNLLADIVNGMIDPRIRLE
jgi:peptide/nickel transport system permease protein